MRPEVTGLSPKYGPEIGGTRLTIRGSDLGESVHDIVSLTVCNVDCTRTVEYVSSKKLFCLTGPGKGSGPVVVVTKSGGKGVCHVNFTYEDSDEEDAAAIANSLVKETNEWKEDTEKDYWASHKDMTETDDSFAALFNSFVVSKLQSVSSAATSPSSSSSSSSPTPSSPSSTSSSAKSKATSLLKGLLSSASSNNSSSNTSNNSSMPAVVLPTTVATSVNVEIDPLGVKPLRALSAKASPSSTAFDPAAFLLEAHSKSEFEELRAGLTHLHELIDFRTEAQNKWMKHNFDDFIACQKALDDLRSAITKSEKQAEQTPITVKFENIVTEASHYADNEFASLLERKARSDSIRNVLSVLQRHKFLFSLPRNMNANIKSGNLEVAIQDYKRMRVLFGLTDIPVFKRIVNEVEQIMKDLRFSLYKKLQRPCTLAEQERTITYLLELDAEDDPVWYCLTHSREWMSSLMRHSLEVFENARVEERKRREQLQQQWQQHLKQHQQYQQQQHQKQVEKNQNSNNNNNNNNSKKRTASTTASTTTTTTKAAVSVSVSKPTDEVNKITATTTTTTTNASSASTSSHSLQGITAPLTPSSPVTVIHFVRTLCDIVTSQLPTMWKLGELSASGKLRRPNPTNNPTSTPFSTTTTRSTAGGSGSASASGGTSTNNREYHSKGDVAEVIGQVMQLFCAFLKAVISPSAAALLFLKLSVNANSDNNDSENTSSSSSSNSTTNGNNSKSTSNEKKHKQHNNGNTTNNESFLTTLKAMLPNTSGLCEASILSLENVLSSSNTLVGVTIASDSNPQPHDPLLYLVHSGELVDCVIEIARCLNTISNLTNNSIPFTVLEPVVLFLDELRVWTVLSAASHSSREIDMIEYHETWEVQIYKKHYKTTKLPHLFENIIVLALHLMGSTVQIFRTFPLPILKMQTNDASLRSFQQQQQQMQKQLYQISESVLLDLIVQFSEIVQILAFSEEGSGGNNNNNNDSNSNSNNNNNNNNTKSTSSTTLASSLVSYRQRVRTGIEKYLLSDANGYLLDEDSNGVNGYSTNNNNTNSGGSSGSNNSNIEFKCVDDIIDSDNENDDFGLESNETMESQYQHQHQHQRSRSRSNSISSQQPNSLSVESATNKNHGTSNSNKNSNNNSNNNKTFSSKLSASMATITSESGKSVAERRLLLSLSDCSYIKEISFLRLRAEWINFFALSSEAPVDAAATITALSQLLDTAKQTITKVDQLIFQSYVDIKGVGLKSLIREGADLSVLPLSMAPLSSITKQKSTSSKNLSEGISSSSSSSSSASSERKKSISTTSKNSKKSTQQKDESVAAGEEEEDPDSLVILPNDTREYTKELLFALISIHAEVSLLAPKLLNRVLGSAAEILMDMYEDVAKDPIQEGDVNKDSALLICLEIKLFDRFLSKYYTKKAKTVRDGLFSVFEKYFTANAPLFITQPANMANATPKPMTLMTNLVEEDSSPVTIIYSRLDTVLKYIEKQMSLQLECFH